MKRPSNALPVMILAAGLAGFSALGLGADSARWAYAGPNGPAKWGSLEKDFAACKLGKNQSPIDIPDAAARKGDMPPLLFNYKASPLRIIDDGHTIRVNYARDSWLSVDGRRFELIEFHFHKPSEEKIDGKGHDMSVHLVHKDKDGKFGIVAVMLDQGKDNLLVKTLWSNLPQGKDKENVVDGLKISATALLPPNKDYYTYAGSLTEPPCSEDVTWFVLKTPMQVSPDAIARFAKYYPMNARPIQPRNDRDILGSR